MMIHKAYAKVATGSVNYKPVSANENKIKVKAVRSLFLSFQMVISFILYTYLVHKLCFIT